MKTCSRCKIEKSADAYYRHKGQCKICVRELARARDALRTPEQRAARVRQNVEYQRTEPGRLARRRAHIKLRYGISLEDYDKMLADQGGTCALCPAEISPYGRRLSVDHDHVTGRVRGILCLRCNNQITLVDRLGIETVAAYVARGNVSD